MIHYLRKKFKKKLIIFRKSFKGDISLFERVSLKKNNMGKVIMQFTLIMGINLFAFLSVGYILDLLFGTGITFKIVCLVLSIFSLVLISTKFFKKALSEIEMISPKGSNDNITKK